MSLYKVSFNYYCLKRKKSSKYSLYNEEFVTFGEDDVYNQKDAEGFINLFTLPLKINAIMKNKNEQTNLKRKEA